MMVACPGCNTRYSLDERKIGPAGGSITCKECGSRWRIASPAGAPSGESNQGAVASSAPARAAVTQPAPATTLRFDESSSARRNPVNCPKCGHTFVPAAGTAASIVAPKRRPGILVIEDQAYFAELTREALGEEFDVTVASTVSGARAILENHRFDVVILDLSLEDGQDGTQILHTTRSQKTPVLVFTARDETELLGTAWDSLKAAGATDILIKGMNVGEELQVKVRALAQVCRRQG